MVNFLPPMSSGFFSAIASYTRCQETHLDVRIGSGGKRKEEEMKEGAEERKRERKREARGGKSGKREQTCRMSA
eukprot:3799752-Rhodomonas_salina.1